MLYDTAKDSGVRHALLRPARVLRAVTDLLATGHVLLQHPLQQPAPFSQEKIYQHVSLTLFRGMMVTLFRS